jgi:predicted membrane channel-forming protein YqfA (hemolysin III family)
MKKNTGMFIFYLIVGLLVINFSFHLINLPDFLDFLDKWIILTGGILILISGLKYLGIGRN